MKKYFLMAVALFVGAVCFTSCGEEEIEKAVDTIISGSNSVKISDKENGKVMELSINLANIYSQVHTATFEAANDSALLNSYIITSNCINNEVADEVIKELATDSTVTIERNGNTLKADLTKQFKGRDKQYFRDYFNTLKEQTERGFNAIKQ